MKTTLRNIVRAILCTCMLVTGFQLDVHAYKVRHDYTIQLNPNGVIRGAWKHDVKTSAKSRGARVDRDRDRGTIGPFSAPYSNSKSVDSSSGSLAKAEANAQITFTPTGGFHQVDGWAAIANKGQWARSYAKSVAAFNVGVRKPNGKIKWKPSWKVDKISGSARVGRDPVDLTLTDLDTGLTRSARLFEVETKMGGAGSSTWENGRLQLDGYDGSFSLNMESPYLSSPGGRMSLAYDEQGIVTHSEDSGVFDGLLPTVGQRALLDLQIGDANGEIDLDYDFTQTGDAFGNNLDLSGDMGGDGMVLKTGDHTSTAQDFSMLPSSPSTVLHGTPFHHVANGPGPGATMLFDPDGDPFDGFLRLTHDQPGEQAAAAFQLTSPNRYDRIDAEFDFRMQSADFNQPGGGMSFSLLPANLYGEDGPIQPDLGAEPNLLGTLGIGLDTFNDPEDECFDCLGDRANHISLHFDGQQVGESRLLDPFGELDLLNGEWNTAVLEVQDVGEGALISLALIDGTDGSEHHVYQEEFIEGLAFQPMRAALAADAGNGSVAHDVDNLFVDFTCSTCADFNGDFQVDQIDLGIWHDAYGNGDFADTDGDGDSDGRDYLQLQREFSGEPFALAASVPEPTTLALTLLSATIAAVRRTKTA